jgi:YebC/PmpR family DNA-binding regulatory protein
MVSCLTDNRNRTVSDVRHAFTRYGGNLGADGSVAYLFNKVGLLSYPAGVGEEQLIEAALEAGAEDVVTNEDGSMDVLTDPGDFTAVRDGLERAGLVPETAEVTLRSSVSAKLDEESAGRMIKLLETLDDMDDVQSVYSNADIPEEVVARLS